MKIARNELNELKERMKVANDVDKHGFGYNALSHEEVDLVLEVIDQYVLMYEEMERTIKTLTKR